ncbi:MarR family winged helix-turn-helix transcriptional regulator [Nocardia sp. NPDC059177]|uniref:MarR family winged helix-turn-helix transcriptional regulator n=1 Tax=Nocardia sp. NPDC059177 TaxID=3346759 RepID=UPI0036BDC6E2
MEPRTAPARLRSMPTWLLTQVSTQGGRFVGDLIRARSAAHRYHYALLAALAEFGPASQAELGRRVGLDRSDVTTTIADLERGGYAQRVPDPVDRRRNLVTITDTGGRHLEHLDTAVRQAQDELLAALSPAERAELVRMLQAVMDHHAPA